MQFPVLAADVVHRDRLHLRGQGPRLRWNGVRRFDERGHDRRLVGAPKKPGRGDHHQQHKQHRQHRQQQRNTGGPRPLEGSQLLLQGFGSGCLDQSRGGELVGLSLRVGNIDMLTDALERHGAVLSEESLAEYVKAGLMSDQTHLPLRVLAEGRLGWSMQEIERQIGEQPDLEETSASAPATANDNTGAHHAPGVFKRSSIVLGKKEFTDITPEEMGAVIGFVKPEQSAKILKDKVGYETAVQQYNRAIQSSSKPASLIIDALKLDYQHEEISQFAKHLWKLYHSLSQYGRQVKERMLGWGYSLGYHEVFDDLEKGPNENKIREIGLERGYIRPTSLQMKAKYRELVQKDSSIISVNASPADEALKKVESLLMYGQLDLAIGILEQAVL